MPGPWRMHMTKQAYRGLHWYHRTDLERQLPLQQGVQARRLGHGVGGRRLLLAPLLRPLLPVLHPPARLEEALRRRLLGTADRKGAVSPCP